MALSLSVLALVGWPTHRAASAHRGEHRADPIDMDDQVGTGVDASSALAAFLAAHPEAGVAAVADDGLFVAVPPGVPVAGHAVLEGRAGIALVGSESRSAVLEQFRQLPKGAANEVQVTLANGAPGRYALFDTRADHGVVMLVLVEGEATGDEQRLAAAELAPPRPRFGTIRRTEVAELIAADDAILQMTGYDLDTFGSIGTSDLVHPDDQEAVVNQWFDMLGSGPGTSHRSRVRYRRSDDSWLWIELTVTNHLDDPAHPHVLSEVLDVSEEMAAHDEIWRHRELLSRLTEALPLGVVQIDAERRVVYANDRVGQVAGVRDATDLDTLLAQVVDDDRDLVELAVADVLGSGVHVDVELRFRPALARTVRYAQVSLRALRDRDDQVTGAVVCITDVTDSTRMRKELEVRATFDVLTRCYNRATVMAEVERALADRRNGAAVVFVDLDGFKAINDTLGHAAGDRLLQAVADALNRVVRSNDVVGRLGGDEFLVLCPGVTDRRRALEIGDRVAEALRMTVEVDGAGVDVRASIGVAWASGGATTAEGLVAAADAAMYDSKRSGSCRPVLAD